jgi:hypothetical protein
MKICILILCTESWQELADIVLPNVERYCSRYHYSFFFNKQKEYDGFDKIRAIKKTFERGDFDIIWSLDCDTLITNHTIRIDDFIEDKFDFYICEDYNGINAGSFIVKNTIEGNWFMNWLMPMKGDVGIYCEQDAIKHYMRLLPEERDVEIKVLPHPSINSYLYQNYLEIPPQTHEEGQWQPNDFLLHLPGLSMDKRLAILNEYKDKVIYQ